VALLVSDRGEEVLNFDQPLAHKNNLGNFIDGVIHN
jgi:hypothetical protein